MLKKFVKLYPCEVEKYFIYNLFYLIAKVILENSVNVQQTIQMQFNSNVERMAELKKMKVTFVMEMVIHKLG